MLADPEPIAVPRDGALDRLFTTTAELLDYACSSGASHFVLASTGGVYAPSTAPLREDHRSS